MYFKINKIDLKQAGLNIINVEDVLQAGAEDEEIFRFNF